MTASGFEEEPQPEPPALAINGVNVTYLGVSPSVSQRIQIVNGKRSEWRDVTFVYRWRIEASEPGDYTVPQLVVTQGSSQATSQPATFTAHEVATTQDMLVRMQLPDRPVWTGETFDVAIEWLLRRDVGDHEFAVPLFNLDVVRVEPPPGSARRTLKFDAGQQEISLPIQQDRVNEDGAEYTRLRFPARITINRPGTIELPPIRVGASLETGTSRDTFGFARSVRQLFKAEGKPRTLEVRSLPLQGRPDSFSNAIGQGLSLDVQASRSVVQVGDPIELQITVRGDVSLEGLSLPSLAAAGLPESHFSIPESDLVGTVSDDGDEKVFDVNVRIRSADATEIPPLELSWFDPARGEYQSARSQPVALSVSSGKTVGAGDVTASPGAIAASTEQQPVSEQTSQSRSSSLLASLIGADMSLSSMDRTLNRALTLTDVRPLLWALYILPVVCFHFCTLVVSKR